MVIQDLKHITPQRDLPHSAIRVDLEAIVPYTIK
jgi:hypothetical protein